MSMKELTNPQGRQTLIKFYLQQHKAENLSKGTTLTATVSFGDLLLNNSYVEVYFFKNLCSMYIFLFII